MDIDKDFIQIAFYIFLLLNDYFNIVSIIFNINKYFDYAYGKKFRNKFKYPTYSFSKPNSVAIKPPLLGSISKKLPGMCNETDQYRGARHERYNTLLLKKETEVKFESGKQKTSSSTVKMDDNENNKTKSSSRQSIQKMFLELDKSRSNPDHKQSSSSSSGKNKKQDQHTLLKMLLQNAEYPWKKIKDKLNLYDTCNGISSNNNNNNNNCLNTSNSIRSKNVKKSRTPFTSHNVRKMEKEDFTFSLPIEANVGHLSNNTDHLLLDKSVPLYCNCEYHQNAVMSEQTNCNRHDNNNRNGLKKRDTGLFHKTSQTFDKAKAPSSKKVKTKSAEPARRSNSYPNQKYSAECNNNSNIMKLKSACSITDSKKQLNTDLLLHKSYRNYLVNPVFVHCSNPNFPRFNKNFNNEITLHRAVSNHDLMAFDESQNSCTVAEEKTHTPLTTVNIKINLENKNSQKPIHCISQEDIYCNLLVDPSSPLCSHNADKQNGCHLCPCQYQKMSPSHWDNTTSSTQKPERINKMVQNNLNDKKDVYVQNPFRENKNIQTEKLENSKNTACCSSRRQIKPDKNIHLVSANNNRLEVKSTSSAHGTSDNVILSSTNGGYQNNSSQYDDKVHEDMNLHTKRVDCPKLVPYSISSSDEASDKQKQIEITKMLQPQKEINTSNKNIDKDTSKCIDIFYNFGNTCNVFQCKVSKTKVINPKLGSEKKFLCDKNYNSSQFCNNESEMSTNQFEENATVFLNGLEDPPWICIFDGINNFKSGSETSLNKNCEYTGNGNFGKELYGAMLQVSNNELEIENVRKNNIELPIMVLLNNEIKQNDKSIQNAKSNIELKYLDVKNCCNLENKSDKNMYKNFTKNYGTIDKETGSCDIKKSTRMRNRSICNIMDYINPLNKGVQFSSDYIRKDNLKIGYIISRIEDLLNILNDNIAEKLNNVKKNEVDWNNLNSYQNFQENSDQNISKPFISIQDNNVLRKTQGHSDSGSSWKSYTNFPKDTNNNNCCDKEQRLQRTKTQEVSLSFSNGEEQKNTDIVHEDTWKTKWLKRLCKNCDFDKRLTYPTVSEIEIKNNLWKSTVKKQDSEDLNKDLRDTKSNSTKIFHCNHCGGHWNEKSKINRKSRNFNDSSDYGNSKIMLKKCLKCQKYTCIQKKKRPRSARYSGRRNVIRKKSASVSKTSVTTSSLINVLDNTSSSHEIILSMMDPKKKEKQKSNDTSRYDVDLGEDTFLKMMEPKRHPVTRDFLREEKTSKQVGKMNGLNGHTNGDLNGCDIITQNQQKGCWTIGLANSKFKYLTAETFGFKINANGASLKKKQIWTLEPDLGSSGESYIYFKSHLDKYLAVDSFGNVTCENDEKDPGSKFLISVAEDGTGRWAFRNVVRGYFLGASQDKLTCTAKIPGDAEFWLVHLAARPQVNLRSVGRKRFAHLSENQDEIYVDANIPWGEDTLFTLEFRADESGKYALHTCNNKYLSLGGKLVDKCSSDCLFTAEYHSGYLALRDKNGSYLSPIGSKAVLKTRSNTVTKDELFSLEDSLPQASFVAALNAKYVSVKQGVDVTANQDEISDHETFQLEFDWNTKRWYIRTMQDRYWTLETGGGIQAAGDKRSSNALFDLIWQGDGSVAFRANNGRYVTTKRSGHLYANSDAVDENSKYFFYLINRPILVLKSEQGFVGYKSGNNTKLECNKAMYETIQVERAEKGIVYFKGQNGKYWHCDTEGVTADSDVPEGFYLELREPTRLSIKSVNGSYLTASKNGVFRLGDSSYESATQWEY